MSHYKTHGGETTRHTFDPTLFERVNASLRSNLRSFCDQWVSDGVVRGDEYVACNPTRADKSAGSFRINLKTGRWADFATGDRGGDPISYYAYVFGLSQIEAARALAVDLGVN
jgi:hypothetical protein